MLDEKIDIKKIINLIEYNSDKQLICLAKNNKKITYSNFLEKSKQFLNFLKYKKKLRPNDSEKKLLNIGKIATSVIVILGIIWIPIMEKIGGGVMYQYLQNVQSYIAPPVAAVFLLGILWKRVNSNAAITTLLAGLVLLVLRLGSEIYYQAEINDNIALDNFMYLFATINFSHMAILMFIFSILG